MTRVKGLSLYQPWATLIAIGAKTYETRSWKTSYRGLIAIHASQRIDSECWRICKSEPINTLLRRAGYKPGRFSWRGCLPLGAIVAAAELVDVLPIHGTALRPVSWIDGAEISDQERALGDWSAGRFAWKLANVRALDSSCLLYRKGARGLWTVPPEVGAEIKRRLVAA